MKNEGPPLELLMHRLAEVPADFILMPVMKKQRKHKGRIIPYAIVSDMHYHVSNRYLDSTLIELFEIDYSIKSANYLRVILLCTYIYFDPWFEGKKKYAEPILDFLSGSKLEELASLVNYKLFISDVERREELVRLCLGILDIYPEGEQKAYAKDRLGTLDSIERHRILKKTKEAQERARKLREAMARKAAEEAASKMSRE